MDDQLPPPAVLVVGDFHTERKHFAEAALEEVIKAYSSFKEPFGAAWTDFNNLADPSALSHRPSRASAPPPYPIAVSDNGNADAEDLGRNLRRLFLRFDVWGVIACTTSRNTPGLLRKLEHSDVPILLTVDSSLTGLEPGPNVLRLVPNNERQAQAIVGKLLELRSTHVEHVQVFYSPLGDRYVEDLCTALRGLADRAKLPLTCSHEARAIAPTGAVVCIGYEPDFKMVHAKLADANFFGPMILSDGCYPNECVKAAVGGKVNFFWCRSLFELSTYAYSGYLGICKQWIQVGRSSSDTIKRGLNPSAKLKPFLQLLRQELEKSADVFKFEGLDNQRGGYVVDEIPSPVSARPNGDGK